MAGLLNALRCWSSRQSWWCVQGAQEIGERDMVLELVAAAVASVGGFITAVLNSITDNFLTKPLQATLQHLEEAELQTLHGGELL